MTTLEKLKLTKYKVFNSILMGVAFVVTAISILTGSYIQDKENVEIGAVSPKRYVATREMEDTTATERLIKQAEESVGPLYKHDTQVQSDAETEMQQFFSDLDELLKEAAKQGDTVPSQEAVFQIPVVLSEKQYIAYSELTWNGKMNYVKDVSAAMTYVFDQGVTEDSMPKALELLQDNLNQTDWSETLRDLAYNVASKCLKPNLVLDNEAIQAAKEQKAALVQPVMIRKGQKIVDEGEIITEHIYETLKELNLINQDYKESAIPLIGGLIIVALLFVATFFYFKTQSYSSLDKLNQMMVLFTVYLISIILLRLTATLESFVFIPVSLFAMLVSILVSTRLALILNMFVAVIGTFIFNGNMEFTLYFLLSGTFAALLVQYTEKRKHILLVALGCGIADAVSMIGLLFFFENGYSDSFMMNGLFAGITGIIALILTVGSIPLWEAVFEINTPYTLLELTNPNNELMRRLMIEAPGTYHHCLIVANLAETAAYETGASSTLARVGSYYHDIGKLKYPLYFSENQVGENPHDNLEPYNSARLIIEHVTYGMKLAEEHNLPQAVRGILQQHHGTTMVKYFYFKAVKKYGKESVNEEDFRYGGPIPQSKEAALVMLADTVEAAVRSTLSDGKNLEQVDLLIKTLIKDKLDDGQLAECDLTIRDLETARKAFLKVFQGMYHDRIAYPKPEELAEARDEKNHTEEIEEKIMEKEYGAIESVKEQQKEDQANEEEKK